MEGCQLAAILTEKPYVRFLGTICLLAHMIHLGSSHIPSASVDLYASELRFHRVNVSTAAYIANFVRAIERMLLPEEIHQKNKFYFIKPPKFLT